MEFDALEPRLLLSADLPLALGEILAPAQSADRGAIVETLSGPDAGAASVGSTAPPAVQSGPFATQTLYLELPPAAALNYAAGSGTALDASLRISDVDGIQMLQLVDNGSSTVLGQQALDADINVALSGSALDDTLTIAFDSAATTHRIDVSFDGGAGNDTLAGSARDTAWTITGANAGSAGTVSFSDVENLRGAADNEDTFTILSGGSLSGLLDGGVGGFDSLALDGGIFASVVYAATGPDAGTIARDGDILEYAGLEPIFDNLSVTDRIIRTSNLPDHAQLIDLGTQLSLVSTDVIPTFESVTFAKPTNSLTIDLGGDLGLPLLGDTLDIQALALNADLIVNGEGGLDAVTVSGNMNLSGNPLTINAEGITVDPGVTVSAGNITLNAVAAVGSLATPDALPLANVTANVNVNGATLSGNNIALTASATLVSSVVNPAPNIPAAALLANVSADVAVTGSAAILATGTFTAAATTNVNATVAATAVTTGAVGEIAVASPVINATARSRLSDSAQVGAGGAVAITAASATNVTATADGLLATTTVGTTTAAPVIVVTTEAFVEDAATVTQSTSLDVTATATGAITTTANSTPAGAALNPATLASLGVATAAGAQDSAAAIAATTLTSTTRAFLDTSGAITSSGGVSLLASSAFNVLTTANATPTVSLDNNGFAVAVNITQINDDAFVGGSSTITTPALGIRTGGGSTLMSLARSGAAGLDNTNQDPNAGAYALNTNVSLSHAYIAGGAALTVAGTTDVTIAAVNTTVADASAEPAGAASIANKLGVGRSVAANITSYTTLASMDAGATLTGARNLGITANGDQTTRASALAGALAGVDASAQTVASSVTANASMVLIDAAATAALSGVLTMRSNHRASNVIRASSDAAAATVADPSAALALPMAVNLANDVSSATVSGTVTAAGSIVIAADADVENEAEGVAGVQGADPAATNAGDLVADEIAFLSNRANLSFGGSPTPPATDPDGVNLLSNQMQGRAAALGVNLANALAGANVTATGSVTSTGGSLSVTGTSDVDSTALASASAVQNLVGLAGALALNAQNTNEVASIAGTASANGIEVRTRNSGDGVHTLLADAVSGTGVQVVAVAGAAAGTLSFGTSNAFIANGA
ncbi:MAG: LEPR-XLL domain-containing protein, partial [Betaproteobacteria bacterium]